MTKIRHSITRLEMHLIRQRASYPKAYEDWCEVLYEFNRLQLIEEQALREERIEHGTLGLHQKLI